MVELNLLLVGVGGVFGGLFRFQLGKVVSQKANTIFPIATFLINISGAFLLGLLTGIEPVNRVYLLLGDGFCGAYTTFSTFMYEGLHLVQKSEQLNAVLYVLGTLFGGVTGYVCGLVIGKNII